MKIQDCAEKIMRDLSGRSGIDIYQYDDEIIDEIREEIMGTITLLDMPQTTHNSDWYAIETAHNRKRCTQSQN